MSLHTLLLGVGAVLATVIVTTVADVLSEEVRTRLDRLPLAIVRAAGRRLPAELRVPVCEEEWVPELRYILECAQGMPVQRLIIGIRFAVGQLWAAQAVGRELHNVRSGVPSKPMPSRWLFTGVALSGLGVMGLFGVPLLDVFGERFTLILELSTRAALYLLAFAACAYAGGAFRWARPEVAVSPSVAVVWLLFALGSLMSGLYWFSTLDLIIGHEVAWMAPLGAAAYQETGAGLITAALVCLGIVAGRTWYDKAVGPLIGIGVALLLSISAWKFLIPSLTLQLGQNIAVTFLAFAINNLVSLALAVMWLWRSESMRRPLVFIVVGLIGVTLGDTISILHFEQRLDSVFASLFPLNLAYMFWPLAMALAAVHPDVVHLRLDRSRLVGLPLHHSAGHKPRLASMPYIAPSDVRGEHGRAARPGH